MNRTLTLSWQCILALISVVQASTALIGNATISINANTGVVTFFIVNVDFTDKPLKYECFEVINDGQQAIDVSSGPTVATNFSFGNIQFLPSSCHG